MVRGFSLFNFFNLQKNTLLCINLICVYIRFKSVCTDTPFWNSGNDYNCNQFAKYYCKNGRFRQGAFLNYAGERFNYPEKNCVACGKCMEGKAIILYIN